METVDKAVSECTCTAEPNDGDIDDFNSDFPNLLVLSHGPFVLI